MVKIRETEFSTTFDIMLDGSKADLRYKTLQNLDIFPENDLNIVSSLTKFQGWDLDKKFVLIPDKNENPKLPFPIPITIGEALVKFCNLTGLLT